MPPQLVSIAVSSTTWQGLEQFHLDAFIALLYLDIEDVQAGKKKRTFGKDLRQVKP